MKATTEQIERVAKWCVDRGQKRFYATEVQDVWRSGNGFATDWEVIGIIAEACKAADIWFDPPGWDDDDEEWVSSCGPYMCDTCGMGIQSPAHAAILAVATYLEAREAPHE